MNDNNIILFRCLCLDLGMRYTQNTLCLHEFDDLKVRLLELAEQRYNDQHLVTKWSDDFNKLFAIKLTAEDLERPPCFKDVYQVLSFALKMPVMLTEEQKDTYVQRFKETERITEAWRPDRNNPVSRLARRILRFATVSLDLSGQHVQEFARHGPGAVYAGEVGSDKNYFDACYDKLNRWFPTDLYYSNPSVAADLAGSNCKSEPFVIARLALVPKTFKGPRGVFVSPKEAVFCQLGIDGALKQWVGRSVLAACWDPYSQVPSQDLAYLGSYNGWSATLDLSDASDRIPVKLISYLFSRPDYQALTSSRPYAVDLPSGERHVLRMLAPMGDGKTFSTLSIVCSVLALSSMLIEDGWCAARLPCEDVIRSYASKVTVFGDDIIVPTRYFEAVCRGLEDHNLKINLRKSFSRGFFREACGCDAYKGTIVTPVRLKVDMNARDGLIKMIGLHNYMCTKYSHLVRTIAELRAQIRLLNPYVGITTNCERHPCCLQSDALEVNRYRKMAKFETTPTFRKKERVRWNHPLYRIEQYCILGEGATEYPSSSDPRWDLSYALLPKHGLTASVSAPWASGRHLTTGSKKQHDTDEALARATGLRIMRTPRTRTNLQYGWCELS